MRHPAVRQRLAAQPSLETLARLLSDQAGPETPLIWFDGATGTGRSVLALGAEVRFAQQGHAQEFLQELALAGEPASLGNASDVSHGFPTSPSGTGATCETDTEAAREAHSLPSATSPLSAPHPGVPSGGAPRPEVPVLDPRCGPGWAVHLSYEFGLEILGHSPLPATVTDPDSGRALGVAVRLDVVLEQDEQTGEATLVANNAADIEHWLKTYGAALRKSCEGLHESNHRSLNTASLERASLETASDETASDETAPVEAARPETVQPRSVHPPARTLPGDRGSQDQVHWRHSEEQYAELIRACLGHIAAGNAYVLCLTNEATVAGCFDPLALYSDLRQEGVTHHSGLIRVGDWALLSLSPERFMTISGGVVESTPIKGTRPRGNDSRADAQQAEDLRLSEKERAENLMIVDLVRNDLSQVCLPESVRVTRFLQVESYPNVHQLVSTVQGRLAPGQGATDALAALFPAGSMTGAPKLRSTEILRDLEAGPRGSYSGCFGYLSDRGDADFAMVIRSVLLEPGRARVGAGGGLTIDSRVEDESAEVRLKAKPLLDALTRAMNRLRPPMSTPPTESGP